MVAIYINSLFSCVKLITNKDWQCEWSRWTFVYNDSFTSCQVLSASFSFYVLSIMLANLLGSLCILVYLKTCGSLGRVLFSFKNLIGAWAQQIFHFPLNSPLRKLTVQVWWWMAADKGLGVWRQQRAAEMLMNGKLYFLSQERRILYPQCCCVGRNTQSLWSDNFCKHLHEFKNWELINSIENV